MTGVDDAVAPDPEGGAEPDGRGGPHAFVADIARPELADADRHHLARVLRLRPGDPLTVADGEGRWRPCRFGPALEPVGPVVVVAPPGPALTVAFAPTKGDRPEWAVQKLTELGVDHVVLLACDRSVVRWERDRADRHLARLTAVAREAAMQSRRSRLPTLRGPVPVGDLLGRPGTVRADRDGAPPSLRSPTILIGPEGGWSDHERATGGDTVGLGAHVLRSETAAVTAGVLLAALRLALVADRSAPSPR
ncbi:MAG TPA: RsmE family RNA methyltransferase [Acidimicrobiales bacterium]|nr:RsmE family RNA methyltransferase [Acidimicrobiales bacterium]